MVIACINIVGYGDFQLRVERAWVAWNFYRFDKLKWVFGSFYWSKVARIDFRAVAVMVEIMVHIQAV